jgi:hypothetical protein
MPEERKRFHLVVIRNQCSPKPQHKVFHNAHSQSIQAQLQPSHLASAPIHEGLESRTFGQDQAHSLAKVILG